MRCRHCFCARPLSSELQHNKRVEARFWPRLEPFSVRESEVRIEGLGFGAKAETPHTTKISARLRSPQKGPRTGFRVQGSGSRVQGSGFRVQGSGSRVQGSGFRVQGPGFRVQGSGFKVQGLRSPRKGPLPVESRTVRANTRRPCCVRKGQST